MREHGDDPRRHVPPLGWPVSLACVRSHFISRFDDGDVYHNIEATSTHPGSFCSDPDEVYVEKFGLPRRAIECGSDLRRLTAREMLATFLSLRGRHHSDCGRSDLADVDYALARVLFPNHRRTHVAAMVPMIRRGAKLFDRGELGHPDSLFEDLAPSLAPDLYGRIMAGAAHPATKLGVNGVGHQDVHVVTLSVSPQVFLG